LVRKLASIQKIEWIQPINGRDKIELAGILGFQIIVKKGEYRIGDKTVFVEIDSVLPEKPEYEFLRSKKFRIKTMKMGDVLSQGICFPLSILPQDREYNLEDDVTEIMGIKQYEATRDIEPEETINNQNNSKKFQHPLFKYLFKFSIFRKLLLPKKENKGFPDFISKTDETRCLHSNVKIETNKGKIRIADIVNKKLDVLIKSYNEQTKSIEYKPIVSYQKYPHNEEWIKLKYKINKYGNRENTIKCTKDHKFFTNKGYIKAEDLKIGDTIYNISNSWPNDALPYFLGMLIGDSHLAIDKRKNINGLNSTGAKIQLTHGYKQIDYLKEKIRILKGDLNKIRKAKSGYCNNDIYQYTFKIDYNLTNTLYKLGCIKEGKFKITKLFCDLLTLESLTYWYLDDGTLRHRDGISNSPSIELSTNSESKEEIDLLIDMLKNRFGIDCNIRKERSYYSIYITIEGTQKFLKLITKYIPTTMRYKTLPKLENEKYCLNKVSFNKEDIILENSIIDISYDNSASSPYSNNVSSYDLEIQDNHNFFANGVLTHNCQNIPHILKNKDVTYVVREKVDGQSGTFFLKRMNKKWPWQKQSYDFGVCSRNLRLWNETDSSYWFVVKKYNIKSILEDLIGDNDFVAIQGECVAPKVQGNKYKVTEPDLYAFNLIYPNRKVPCIEGEEILKKYGIKWCPLINKDFVLPDSVNELLDYSTGKSALYDTLREGVVLRNYDKGISFKAVSPDFLIKYGE